MAVNKITINAGGKDRLFRFDMYAIEVFLKNESNYKGQFADIAKMLHAGMESACYAKEKDNDFTKEDVLDILEELALTDEGKIKMDMIRECMAQSQVFKSSEEIVDSSKEIEEQEKKSLLNGNGYTPSLLEKSA